VATPAADTLTSVSAPPAPPAAPQQPPPGPSTRAERPPLFRHPWRLAIIAVICLAVLNLGIILMSQSDTAPEGHKPIAPNGAVESVSPGPGELARLQDTITADLRDDLTGVLLIDGQEVPEDQLERIVPLAEVSFRPGPDHDLEKFEPGQHTVVVYYWPQGEERPADPAAYSWTFRAGA
jgi:hypothetical protein